MKTHREGLPERNLGNFGGKRVICFGKRRCSTRQIQRQGQVNPGSTKIGEAWCDGANLALPQILKGLQRFENGLQCGLLKFIACFDIVFVYLSYVSQYNCGVYIFEIFYQPLRSLTKILIILFFVESFLRFLNVDLKVEKS